jgi:hypothetical protein
VKITTKEEKGCFGFAFEAESVADAAFLVRFASNATKEIRSQGAICAGDGTVNGHIVVGKRQDGSAQV